MPPKQVALIRGINVGKAKRISMAELRDLVTALGFTDVATLLNSGNVIFRNRSTPDKAAAKIEKALVAKLCVAARVTVIAGDELAEIVADNPLAKIADDDSKSFVAFFRAPADRKLAEPLATQDWTPERLALGQRVAYFWCPDGILESPLAAAIAKAMKDAVTSRNWATVTKLKGLTDCE